jgi:hypothetical protein
VWCLLRSGSRVISLPLSSLGWCTSVDFCSLASKRLTLVLYHFFPIWWHFLEISYRCILHLFNYSNGLNLSWLPQQTWTHFSWELVRDTMHAISGVFENTFRNIQLEKWHELYVSSCCYQFSMVIFILRICCQWLYTVWL